MRDSVTGIITDAVKKLWNEWDIRIFMVASLFLQVLLIFLAPIRKRRLSRWLTAFTWAFYLLADWVAAFSLGLLSDSQSDDSNCGSSTLVSNVKRSAAAAAGGNGTTTNKELQAFWAPFLLLHLGGPDTITAFALEDNELWLRHLLGLLFEVSMAAYVFSRAFPMKRLLFPTLLMFLAGIIKYGERTRALFLASMDGFRDSMLGKPDPGPNYAKLMNEYTSKREANLQATIEIKNEEPPADAGETDNKQMQELSNIQVIIKARHFFKTFKGLVANLIFSFRDRDKSRAYFQKLSEIDAFRVVEAELSFMYEVLFTKGAVIHGRISYVLRAVCSCAILGSLLLFVFTNKPNYDKVDIGITYALLVGAMSLDIAALMMLLFSDEMIIFFFTRYTRGVDEETIQLESFFAKVLEGIQSLKYPRWSEAISQYNLIDYCLSSIPICVRQTSSAIGVLTVLEHFLYTSCTPLETDLKKFIFLELKRKSVKANDSKSIKMLCSCRGSWVLEDRGFQNELGWSVEKEFDESLLLWHIATDICYSVKSKNEVWNPSYQVSKGDSRQEMDTNATSSQVNDQGENEPPERNMSKRISDYMLYLLVVQPSMMSSMAGIGLLRYRDTCEEAKNFFPKKTSKSSKAREMLLEVNTEEVTPLSVKGDRSKSVLFDAVRLSRKLNKLPHTRKWKIIAEVWVELLSYAASHCRGNAHAARLSKGGELLMFIWFLMAHLGLGEQYCIESGHATAKLIVEK
ncbi:hypothetical protein ACHQM5_007091 [Ranunculus cassubicifolius]